MKRYNLKSFREKQGLTQQQMADKLEISKSCYVLIELGRTDPSFTIAEKIHALFNYDDIWDLFKKGV